MESIGCLFDKVDENLIQPMYQDHNPILPLAPAAIHRQPLPQIAGNIDEKKKVWEDAQQTKFYNHHLSIYHKEIFPLNTATLMNVTRTLDQNQQEDVSLTAQGMFQGKQVERMEKEVVLESFPYQSTVVEKSKVVASLVKETFPDEKLAEFELKTKFTRTSTLAHLSQRWIEKNPPKHHQEHYSINNEPIRPFNGTEKSSYDGIHQKLTVACSKDILPHTRMPIPTAPLASTSQGGNQEQEESQPLAFNFLPSAVLHSKHQQFPPTQLSTPFKVSILPNALPVPVAEHNTFSVDCNTKQLTAAHPQLSILPEYTTRKVFQPHNLLVK